MAGDIFRLSISKKCEGKWVFAEMVAASCDPNVRFKAMPSY